MRVKNKLGSLLLLCICICATTARGQNRVTDSTATVITYWKKKEKARFTLVKSKEKYRNDKLLASARSESEVEVSIIDSTASYYIVDWKYVRINIVGEAKDVPIVQQILKLSEGLSYRYKISETGEFLQLMNMAEIQKRVTAVLDQLAKTASDPQSRVMVQESRRIFTTRESIEQVMMKDVQAYHSPYGLEYKLHGKLEGESQIPNFLGGDPFPATMSIEMTGLDKTAGTCTIETALFTDKEKLTKELEAWAKRAGAPANTQLPEINMRDESVYRVDLPTGWVTRFFYTRNVTSDDTRNIETVEITKQDWPLLQK